MFKLLLLLLGVWIVLTILKRRQPPAAEPKTGTMVRCAVCGVYLPENEAIVSGGRHYCCEAHFLAREQA